MRKLISWVSAVSMIATSFTAVMTAQAADATVLYSDSFDGYETSLRGAGGSVFAGNDAGQYGTVQGNPDWQWIFDAPESQSLDKLTVGNASGDDTGVFTINEKEDTSDKYLQTRRNRFPNRCKPSIDGFNQYTANEGEDLVIAFDLMLTDTSEATAKGYYASVEFMSGDTSLGTIDTQNENVTSGEWVKVKAVTKDGTTDIYINNQAVITDAAGTISTIRPQPLGDAEVRITGNYVDYPIVSIDELVIMSAADGATAEIPEAEDKIPAEPEETTPTPPVNYEKAVTYDFESGENPIVIGSSFSSEVVDGTNSTKVLSVTGSSNNSDRFGYAYIDISKYTEGKSNIKVEYDAYINSDGRMVYSVAGALPGSYSDEGLFRQGYAGSSPTNCAAATWMHTTVEADLITGKGTYTVTNGDASIASGSTIQSNELKYIVFLSWSPNTSYIDNIVVSTAGEREIATPKPTASPEPEATVEGSDVTLLPADYTAFGTMQTVEGTESKVLNHSKAKQIVNGDVSAYSQDANVRGKSVYAAFDVYVNAEDSVSVKAQGSSDLGTTFVLTGNADGTAVASAFVDKGAKVTIDGNLVCGTWYRVLIEEPQINNSGATNTGDAIYTIYRIDREDTTKVSEVAVSKDGLTPRNLSGKGLTRFTFEGTGTPYIDNGVVFYGAGGFGYVEKEPVESEQPSDTPTASPEPAGTAEGSNLNLAPESARDIKNFAGVEGAATEILNHSKAKSVVNGDVDAYSNNAKGNAIYAIYDVLVNAGDELNVAAYGNSNALGTTFILTGNADGTATASALVDKADKDGSTVTLNGNLVCGTWYRVKIELPQSAAGVGNARYTIYRINPTDPTKTTGIAAEATGLAPRNLSDKQFTKFTVSGTGTPYIDNGVTYIDTTSENTWYRYHYTENDGIKTVTLIEKVSDPSKNGPEEGKSYVWNELMQPYVASAAE